MNRYKIKNLPLDERPRERLKKVGVENLSDKELISIILKTGTKDKSVNALAIDILNKYKLDELKEVSINKLIDIKGIGEVKAIELIASIELGKRIFLNKTYLIKDWIPQKEYMSILNIYSTIKNKNTFIVFILIINKN